MCNKNTELGTVRVTFPEDINSFCLLLLQPVVLSTISGFFKFFQNYFSLYFFPTCSQDKRYLIVLICTTSEKLDIWLTWALCYLSDLGVHFFALFASISCAGLQERPIQGLASGDCCTPICANHINSDFKSEFHPFHLSSVIQRPIKGWHCSQLHTPHLIWIRHQSFTECCKDFYFGETPHKQIFFLVFASSDRSLVLCNHQKAPRLLVYYIWRLRGLRLLDT